MEKSYYKVSEVANALNMHPSTIRKMIKSGELEAAQMKKGGNNPYYVTTESFEELKRKNKIDSDIMRIDKLNEQLDN